MSSVFAGVSYVQVGPNQWLERPVDRLLMLRWTVQTQEKIELEDGRPQRYTRRVLVPHVLNSPVLAPAVVQQMLESVGLSPTPEVTDVQLQDAAETVPPE